MQFLETSPVRNAGVHLTNVRELEQHCRNENKHGAYERLLIDFGIDLESFNELVEHPRLIVAEQPGCWYYGDDLMRVRLLDHLVEAMDFHPSSGVLSLANDSFTVRGLKKYFLNFEFHPALKPVAWVGSSFIRRYRNRIYSAVPIDGSAFERFSAVLEISLAMISSARISAAAFAGEVTSIFEAGLRPGLRPLLPASHDKAGLRELGRDLRRVDLESARRPLEAARRRLRPGISWSEYWDMVNGDFLGTRIGRLGPLFNRYLLAIGDPVRMSTRLARLCGHPAGKPIAVAAVVVADKYRMVFYDPERGEFFYRPEARQRRKISWSWLRGEAEKGRTGGPSAVLEYLMMAAGGIYLLVDPLDGHTRFETKAREIHRQYTGLPFPYISFGIDEGDEETVSYLKIYTRAYEDWSRGVVEDFFR